MTEFKQEKIKKFDWFTFLSYWIGAHFIFAVLRGTLYSLTLSLNLEIFDPSLGYTPLFSALFSLIFFLFLIASQTMILSPYMNNSGHWLFYSLFALPLTSAITWASQTTIQTMLKEGTYLYISLISFAFMLLSHLVMGIAQWLALRASFKYTGWWPFIRMASGVVGSIASTIFVFVYSRLVISYSLSPSNLIEYLSIFNGLLITFITALITGSALSWFIQHPKDDDMLIEVV